MNRFLKAIAYATIVFSYNAVQTSLTNKTINRAYEFGVTDGIALARDFNRARSQQIEREMIATKYGRYAKVVE